MEALVYARYSSTNQREESIDAQLRAIGDYASRNNINIIRTYTDEAQTAKNDDRDNFQEMIEAVVNEAVKIDAILVHKFNRFARSTFDSYIYKKKLKDMGIRVISITQLVDDTPEGEMFERFLEAIDEYYSKNLALEVKKGLKENALKGLKVGGKTLIGYDINENGFHVINENADIVRRIFNDFADGMTISQICKALNSEGLRNQQGENFKIRSIGDMLKNEKYIGVFNYKLSKSETIRIENIIPVIIDRDLWNRVQSLHKTRPDKRPNKKNTYHLTGKAYCLSCGCKISGAGGGKKLASGEQLWYYDCVGKSSHKNGCNSKKINKKWIEHAVVKSILEIAFDEKVLKEISALAFKQIEKTASESTESIDKIKKQLRENLTAQKNTMIMFSKGKLSEKLLDEQSEELSQEQIYLETQLSRIMSVQEAAGIVESDVYDFIKNYISRIKETPSVAVESLIQSLINAFLEKIEINNETVKIQLRLDFFSLKFKGCDNVRFAGAIRSLSPLEKSLTYNRSQMLNFDLCSILTECSE